MWILLHCSFVSCRTTPTPPRTLFNLINLQWLELLQECFGSVINDILELYSSVCRCTNNCTRGWCQIDGNLTRSSGAVRVLFRRSCRGLLMWQWAVVVDKGHTYITGIWKA